MASNIFMYEDEGTKRMKNKNLLGWDFFPFFLSFLYFLIFARSIFLALIRKKARKAMPSLWLFSFRAGNRVSIFAWGNLGDLEDLLSYDEAVRAFDGAGLPTVSANFMQNFKSLGLLVLRIYPIT